MSSGRDEPKMFTDFWNRRVASFVSEKRLVAGSELPVPVPVPVPPVPVPVLPPPPIVPSPPVPVPPVPVPVPPVPLVPGSPKLSENCDQSKPRAVSSFMTTETSATCIVISDALRPRRIR
jgi:hypothetical protein